MNIVQIILDLLSGNVLSKLSGLIGENEAKTKAAAGAAVPALLSGLANLASNEQGAQKLAGALGKIDPGMLNNLGSLLSGGSADSVAEQGGSALSSLLGGSTVTGLVTAIARLAGLNGGAAKTLISLLGPIILSAIAKHFSGKSVNAQGLMNFFSSQKANIADAVPSGLSLADIPGLETTRAKATAAYGSAKDAAAPGKSLLPWILGLAALAAIAFFLWRGMPSESPEVAKLSTDVSNTVSTLGNSLTNITDVASAEAAIPTLRDLSGKLDGMQAVLDKLPTAAKSTISALIKPALLKLSDQFNRVLMIPGAGTLLRPAIEGVAGKLAQLGGLKPDEFSLPSPQVTDIGSNLSAVLASLTESLTSVKDAATADAALPKLQELNGQLDRTTADWEKLPATGKATIGSVIKSALSALTGIVQKVLAMTGISSQFKPVADEILRKLNSLTT